MGNFTKMNTLDTQNLNICFLTIPEMNRTKTVIAVLQPRVEVERDIKRILHGTSYEVIVAVHVDSVLNGINKKKIDLIVCPQRFGSETAFSIFRRLKPFIVKSGIPFFVLCKHYNKDDLVIGLEIGIDNFLFEPLITDSVLAKITEALERRMELNVFGLTSFKNYFETSSIAMFFMEENVISAVNDSFCRLTKSAREHIVNMEFKVLFDFNEDRRNEMNYRRFINGVIGSCKLCRVSCCQNYNIYFDVSFYRGNQFDVPTVFAEVQPSFDIERGVREKGLPEFHKDGKQQTDGCKVKLTQREKDVFQLSAKGLGLKQIAATLELSPRTVEKHRANIMRKTNTHSMFEAILAVEEKGRI